MSCSKSKRRRQEKLLLVAGQVPTVPTVADHCTNGWLVTDIYKGEICINVVDQITYSRGNTGIFVVTSSGGGVQSVTGNIVDNTDPLNPVVSEPYLVYTALLTQTGTNAPVATVLRNTLGGTPVWTRSVAGAYQATLAGVFTANKTFLVIPGSTIDDTAFRIGGLVTSVNTIDYITNDGSSLADGCLQNTSIEIRVYP